MTGEELRWLSGLHGVLGWLAVVGATGALVGAGRARRRRTLHALQERVRARVPRVPRAPDGQQRGDVEPAPPAGDAPTHGPGWTLPSIGLSAVLLGAAFGSGMMLDLPYRGLLRQRLFLASPFLGWMFERKLHLSFGAVVLAGCAGALWCAAGLARRAQSSDASRVTALERAGQAALLVSTIWALAAAAIAVLVARRVAW